MIISRVRDAGDLIEHHPTKGEAIKSARWWKKRDGEGLVVEAVDIGKVTKAAICCIANGEGYVVSFNQVWPVARPAKTGSA